MQSWKLRLLGYLAGAWQFRWPGLAAAFIICMAGWFTVALIPNTFESEAKVYIDTDTILRPLLRGLAVTSDANQQVNIMLRTLLSKTNVERVVRATDVTASTVPPTVLRDKIESIQRRVQLKDLGTTNLYSIAFRDSNPRYAQSVTQSLLSVLIDSNLGSQRQDTEGAKSFIDSQIAEYERKLAEADKRREDFKAANIDLFAAGPGGAVEAGGGVASAASSVVQAQNALDEAVARRNSLRAQVGSTQATMDVNAPSGNSSEGGGTTIYALLATARAKLSDLRTHYTEDYPDVIAQKNQIARLQAEIASNPTPRSFGGTQGIANPSYVALRTKLADEEANVAVAQERLATAQRRLSGSKGSAIGALSVERQYQDLDRDYKVLNENYQQLVARRESANISQAAGSQQSATFRVIDPPMRPDRPVAPNRPLYNLLVLVGGLGIGAALALGLSIYQDRFFSTDQLDETFGVPLIGSITASESASDLAVNRRAIVVFTSALGILMFGYLIIVFLFHSQLAASQGFL